MDLVLSYILVALGVFTLTLARNALRGEDGKLVESRMFAALAISSSIWSFFFGILLVQHEARMAYFCRCAGMVGTFGYLISAMYLISHWGNFSRPIRMGSCLFSLTAILLYPFLMNYNNVIYERIDIGIMSYTFVPNVWNSLYNGYCYVFAVCILYMGISMWRKAERQRMRVLGGQMLVSLVVIFAGMLLDTVFPMFGMGAFPGSSIAQGLGVIIAYGALRFARKNRVNITNMSEFIYSTVETPVLIYTEKGILEMANNSAREFLGLSEEDYGDNPLHQFFELDEDILQQSSTVQKIDTKCRVKEAYCRLGINTIYDRYKDVIGYIITIDDLTDKMQIIGQLEEASRQADLANKAKSAFLAKMSHEIRTPINAILGMDEMILRESKEEKISEYAGSIQDAGKVLLSIINDILDLSKIESGKFSIIPDKYSVPEMLISIVDIMTVKVQEKGLDWKLEIDRNIPTSLFGDELRIKQIITNIMNNSVKYTEEGYVLLRMEWEETGEDQGELVIEVTDTGIGIRKEDMEKLFAYYERFDETRNHFVEGTGLGLTITKNLVEMMNGSIKVSSIYGKGSSFFVRVPQKVMDGTPMGTLEEAREARTKQIEESELFTAPEAKILVVDDNIINLMIASELLKRTEIQVEVANSGENCLELISQNNYHIIFLDHMMPTMDGIETLKEMKKMENNKSVNAAVIVLTANAITGAKEMYLKEGFDDYLSKPIDCRELEEMIRRYLPEELILCAK